MVGGEIRGRSFKHCQVSATGGKQVQRQQGVLKVFDILPGGLPNACKCLKGGSPFCAHGRVSKEPQSVQCFKDLCSLKIPPPGPPPAENISKQIPSWLTAAGEVWCAAYSPPTGPSVKWNKTSTIYLLRGCIQPAPSPGTLRGTQYASVFVHRIWRARVQKGNFSKQCVGVALEIPCILLWKK